MRKTPLTPFALAVFGLTPLAAQAPKPPESGELQSLLNLLNTRVVSASKTAEKLSEAPATILVISKEDIERRGYTEFREIFDDLPGFDTMVTYGDTFVKSYARGYRNNIGDSFLIMVDGKVFNHLWFNTTDSATVAMPLSNIERVEVVYGPASAMYGANAFMGVINVITARGTANSTTVNANVMGGSYSRKGVDLTWQQHMGTWGYSFTVRRYEGDLTADVLDRYEYTSTKFWKPYLGKNEFGNLVGQYGGHGIVPWNTTALDLRLWSGNLEFGVQHLSLKSTYGNHYVSDQYFEPSTNWERPEWAFFVKYDHEITQDFTTTATARYRLSGASSSNLDWWTRWDSGAKAFYSYPEYWAEQSTSMDYNQDFQWNPTNQLAFSFGYVLSQEVQQNGYMHGIADGARINNAVAQPSDAGPKPMLSLSDSLHLSVLRRGAYVQGKYHFDEHQSILLGMRDDWHSAFKEAVTLRLGYVGNWGGFNLKALHGQAYQEPTPRQLYVNWAGAGGSATLKPQRSATTELGASYATAQWSVNADLYKIKNSNLILTVPGGAQNAGIMDVTGLDLGGQLKFPGVLGKELSFWSYLTNTIKATGSPYNTHLNTLNSNKVGDIATTKWNFGITALFNDFMSLNVKGRHIGARDTIATNPAKSVDAYNTIEMYFQYNNLLVRGLSLGLKVTNVTDAKYFQPGLGDADAGITPAAYNGAGDFVGSQGYHSSLLPQAGRGFEALIRYQF